MTMSAKLIIESMLITLAAREPETYAHSFRVRAYVSHVAKLMGYPERLLPCLEYAAVLHDIGKIAVSHLILLKPGRLTDDEFKKLQVHSVVGEHIVRQMGFLNEEAKIIRHHHERWDGQGYPDGLRGTYIPFGARLFAVADTFDAMTSNRCYRLSLGITKARDEIATCIGSQFDPEIADAYLNVSPETWAILRAAADATAQVIVPQVSFDSACSTHQAFATTFQAVAEQ